MKFTYNLSPKNNLIGIPMLILVCILSLSACSNSEDSGKGSTYVKSSVDYKAVIGKDMFERL